MSSTPPLDITVVYSRSSRGRRRAGGRVNSYPRVDRWVLLGMLNLAVAGTLYYATWWVADPDLQVKILMNTEFGGIGSDDLVAQMMPARRDTAKSNSQPTARSKPVAMTPPVQGLTSKGAIFGASLYGWEALSTLSICALALASGTMLRRGVTSLVRFVMAVVAAGVFGALGWTVYGLWTRYGGYVPAELRYGSAAAMAAAMLIGLLFVHNARRVARLSAALLILAAVSTSWGLYIAVQSDALDPKYATTAYLAGAFVLHSLWGWILIPLAARFPST